MRKLAVALVLVPFLQAGPGSAQGESAGAVGEPQTFRGMYSARSTGAGFTPCQSKTRLKASDETPESLFSAMYAEVSRDNPSGQVFAQITGIKSGKSIRVLGVEKMYREGPGCREVLSHLMWKARGYEPGWWMEADALAVRFQPMSESAPIEFPYRAFTKKDSSLTYESETESGPFSVLLLPHRCHDAMAGGIYSWRAEVTFKGEKYAGCAYPGDANP
jgi:uncharacterized membrane protein